MNCYEARDALISGSIDLGVFYEDVGGTQHSLTCYEIEACPLTLVASAVLKQISVIARSQRFARITKINGSARL